jgi:alkylation response protein AidB-like acyl-CoA dehydrogenase
MHGGRSLSRSTDIADLVAAVGRAADDAAWHEEFRRGFDRLRPSLTLHPEEQNAPAMFEAAAETARTACAECLPFGLALVMHLYPLCAVRCVPLPWWSAASRRRARLLHAVDSGGLLLANAGSERAAGAHEPVTLSRTRGGILVDGTYDYVSLAHVADVVLFSAPFEHAALFCAADLHGDSVRIGASRFTGSMRLSDTCSVTFDRHFVPTHRCIEVPTAPALQCMAQYQRSWFQLLLAEGYLARIERLHRQWGLPRSIEQLTSLNELAQLREYALGLLEKSAAVKAVESLARVSATIKLRVSLLAQATAATVSTFDDTSAHELGFLKRQPTSDERILALIRAADTGACKKTGNPVRRPLPIPPNYTVACNRDLRNLGDTP